MKLSLLFTTILVGMTLSLSSQMALAAGLCSQVFIRSLPDQSLVRAQIYRDLYRTFYANEEALPERTRNAWVRLLNRSFYDGSLLEPLRPDAFTKTSSQDVAPAKFNEDWLQMMKTRSRVKIGSQSRPKQIIPAPGGTVSEVFQLEWNNKIYYFRPFTPENEDTVRKTMTASWFNNEVLGLKTVAHAQWAEVWASLDGEPAKLLPGSLSEMAPGIPTDVTGPEYASTESVLTAWGFEYIIGNVDARSYNMTLNNTEVTVFDHSNAFEIGIRDLTHRYAKWRVESSIGAEFPPKYSPRFVRAFKRLGEPDVISFLKQSLTPKEFQALQIRIALMTIDMGR